MPFFEYTQNASGGSFKGPAYLVIVEAHNARAADYRVTSETDIYFEGCESGQDCSCCGDRWCAMYGSGDETIDFEALNRRGSGREFARAAGIPWILIIRADGTQVQIDPDEDLGPDLTPVKIKSLSLTEAMELLAEGKAHYRKQSGGVSVFHKGKETRFSGLNASLLETWYTKRLLNSIPR